jgi:hypothetical protein
VRVEPEGVVAVHEARTALERMWSDVDTSMDPA